MVLNLWSSARKSKETLTDLKEGAKPVEESKVLSSSALAAVSEDSTSESAAEAPPPAAEAPSEKENAPPKEEEARTSSSPSVADSAAPATQEQSPRPRAQQRFSWRNLVNPKGVQDRKPALPTLHEQSEKEAIARREYTEKRILRARSDKRAHESALVVRDLIVGPFAAPSAAPPKRSKIAAAAVPPQQKVQKVKAQLLQPKSAKKVIAELRHLPSSDVPVVVGKTATGEEIKALSNGPIHAVCLPFTEAEAQEKRFAKLDKVPVTVASTRSAKVASKTTDRSLDLTTIPTRAYDGIASVTSSSIDKLKEMVADLDVVSLISVPDLGLGQPVGSPGILAGAVPTAKAVIEGVEQITPQLMALGYATGKSILPSHDGVYPPTDRMSVITYWWGLEVVMPEPSVQYLSNAPSIAHTVVNFLTALSVANGGVREILPFVRYISQYIDAEFNAIRDQDQGKGVVCAATWIMPAALVPRPWDFPDPPANSQPGGDNNSKTPASVPSAGANQPDLGPIMLTPPLPNRGQVPILASSAATNQANSERVPPHHDKNVPGVTVTPPTPPAAETLGKSARGPFASKVVDPADAANENGVAAYGDPGANEGVVNGTPIYVVA